MHFRSHTDGSWNGKGSKAMPVTITEGYCERCGISEWEQESIDGMVPVEPEDNRNANDS